MLTIEAIRQMLVNRIPRKEIAEKSGYSVTEIGYFAKAWGIPAYGQWGRPRKVKDQSSK
jgi:hypothetical protein